MKWRLKRIRENPVACCKGNYPEWTVDTLKTQSFGRTETGDQTITTIECPSCKRQMVGTSSRIAIDCWNHDVEISKRERSRKRKA